VGRKEKLKFGRSQATDFKRTFRFQPPQPPKSPCLRKLIREVFVSTVVLQGVKIQEKRTKQSKTLLTSHLKTFYGRK